MLSGTRVLMTADAVGGIWTYALDLARGLGDRGATVTLAVLGPAVDAERRRRAEADGVIVIDTGAAPEWLAETAAEVEAAARTVARLAGEARADLVHLSHPVLAGLARFPCPVVGVAHSCVATWWAAVRGGPLPADLAWRAALVGEGYRAVDVLVAPTVAFAEATRLAYTLPALPRVVLNGRTTLYPSHSLAPLGRRALRPARGEKVPDRADGGPSARPARSIPPHPALARHLLPSRGDGGNLQAAEMSEQRNLYTAAPARAVFSAGRLWDEGKGARVLDEAATHLTCPVELAGPPNGPNGTRVALRHARALGPLGEDAMAERFAARPVYAAPALYEPFGLAVVEAAQAGCALVLSDIPTFRELWDGAACFVPPRDSAALATTVQSLLDDPSRRDALGHAAAERARRYGLDAMVEGTVAVHEAVLRDACVAEAPAP